MGYVVHTVDCCLDEFRRRSLVLGLNIASDGGRRLGCAARGERLQAGEQRQDERMHVTFSPHCGGSARRRPLSPHTDSLTRPLPPHPATRDPRSTHAGLDGLLAFMLSLFWPTSFQANRSSISSTFAFTPCLDPITRPPRPSRPRPVVLPPRLAPLPPLAHQVRSMMWRTPPPTPITQASPNLNAPAPASTAAGRN